MVVGRWLQKILYLCKNILMSVFFNKYIIAYNKVIDVNGEKELLPRFLSYSDFQKWLMRCRRLDKDMQVIIKPIVISK